jgi:hypothetical protein
VSGPETAAETASERSEAPPVANAPVPADAAAPAPADGPPLSEPWTVRLGRAWRWLLAFSFPRRFPIIQFPNLPLALAFVAGQTSRHVHGPVHFYATALSYLSMAVWAYLELFEGVNWFRRLLGAFYVASTTIHLEHTLAH